MCTQCGYPLEISLPTGRAQLIAGSIETDYPRYILNGEWLVELDVRIPPDLKGGWFWHGSFLQMVTPPGECGLAIDSGTYPPPGMESVRGTCFDAAREIEAVGTRIQADLAEAHARRAKRTKWPARDVREVLEEIPDRIVAEPEPMLQLEMEL